MNKIDHYRIENGNTVRLEAANAAGRVHMKGSGDIHAYVSMEGVKYTEVPHLQSFDEGVAEFPINCFIGDKLMFTADTITDFQINWNNDERSRR